MLKGYDRRTVRLLRTLIPRYHGAEEAKLVCDVSPALRRSLAFDLAYLDYLAWDARKDIFARMAENVIAALPGYPDFDERLLYALLKTLRKNGQGDLVPSLLRAALHNARHEEPEPADAADLSASGIAAA